MRFYWLKCRQQQKKLTYIGIMVKAISLIILQNIIHHLTTKPSVQSICLIKIASWTCENDPNIDRNGCIDGNLSHNKLPNS